MERDQRRGEQPGTSDRHARGIVIRPGGEKPIPVACWAYLWTADEEIAEHHWHELVPATRTG